MPESRLIFAAPLSLVAALSPANNGLTHACAGAMKSFKSPSITLPANFIVESVAAPLPGSVMSMAAARMQHSHPLQGWVVS